MKRPAFQFYPGDWQHDVALRSCSVGARGLWIEMMCVMHQADPYGYLVLNGKPIDRAQLGRMVGASDKDVRRWLDELVGAGVHSEDADGRIYSRRMVRDERLRVVRGEAGKLGGNPALVGVKDKTNVIQLCETKDNQSATPSSSSSASLLPDAPASGGVDGHPDCPHDRIVALYHELLPICPRVLEWNEGRRAYLRSRWRAKSKPNGTGAGYTTVEAGIEWWRQFFAWVAQSKFLTGQAGVSNGRSKPFVADLEWLVTPNNFAKVIEGKYHDRQLEAAH
jgi:hypothetical protein